MKLEEYSFLYNAAAYFAAKEHFGAKERAALEALRQKTPDDEKNTQAYKQAESELEDAANRQNFVSLITQPTQEGFEALCWAVAELATQGELLRRHMGYEPRELLTAEKVRRELAPHQVTQAISFVMAAVIHGIHEPSDADDEVDEVMEELQKKKREGTDPARLSWVVVGIGAEHERSHADGDSNSIQCLPDTV